MRIALLGDIALFGVFSKNNNLNICQKLKEIADYLSQFDYVVGNLETPFTKVKKTYGAKSAYICSDPENVDILKYLHVNAVTLANNHMFDFGDEGYRLTKDLLDEAGIKWFGSEGKQLKIEKNSCKIAFNGFCCYTSNPLKCVSHGNYGINAYNLVKVRELIESNSKEGFLNVVAIHAGMEHVNYPSIEHIRAARALAKIGHYVYYGHHPHVVQGVEEYNGSLIAHSLGNFCFDDVWTDASSEKPLVELTENNRLGMILELTVENNKLVAWKDRAIHIDNDGTIRLLMRYAGKQEYSEAIVNCENNVDEYVARRQSILSERMANRKAARTISWYLKRLRPRYVNIILNARKNAELYRQNVLNLIK